jgi:pimeloyl-ACP methyl ester carboxylesterase
LGEAPSAAPASSGRYGAEAPHIAALLGRGQAGNELEKQSVVFGEYVAGDVFLPVGAADSGRRLPAALWLHPFSVPRGYIAGYMRGEQPVRTLARAGFAVLGFDQIGHGRRIEDAERFYPRHPRWSLLGKMVRDSQAALDALTRLPYVDPESIWVVGYGLGAMVGLHLAALDDRLAGLAAVCPPAPFRTDTDETETGGLRRWTRQHALLPRLDRFIGREGEVPYDLDDLLASLAPKPTLVLSPTLDYEAPLTRVTAAVESAHRAFTAAGAADRLEQLTPVDYNRFPPATQSVVADWLKRQAATGGAGRR